MEMERVSTYEAKIILKGQDVRGTWIGNGSYVNSQVGPLVWWFKNYDDYDSQNDLLVFEIQREMEGKYEGRWYYSGSEFVEGRSGRAGLRKLGASSENLEVDLDQPDLN